MDQANTYTTLLIIAGVVIVILGGILVYAYKQDSKERWVY